MTKHPRIPAFAAILFTTAIGLGLLAGTGQFRATDLAHASLADLEKKIVGSKDGHVWLAYGHKLRETGRLDLALKAYQRALELQPDLTDARLAQGLTLGQAGNPDAFFDYIGRLSMVYPKVAVDLLDRAELRPLHADPRWEPAAAAALAQAVD